MDLCPNGFSECCYNSREFVRSIEGTCVPVGQKCSESSGVGNRASGLLAGTIGELYTIMVNASAAVHDEQLSIHFFAPAGQHPTGGNAQGQLRTGRQCGQRDFRPLPNR